MDHAVGILMPVAIPVGHIWPRIAFRLEYRKLHSGKTRTL